MKFLIDAQLPRRLSHQIAQQGYDTIHTLDLPGGNRTPDIEIIRLAVKQERIVVTKDSDFVASYLLHGVPPKLLLVSTGNITNNELCELFNTTLVALDHAFANHTFVELSQKIITIHA